MAGRLGGLGEEREADAAIQEIAEKVKSTVEEQSGQSFSEYIAITYCTQVVAGINYFIKIKVGSTDYIAVRVYQNLQQDISLSGYKLDMTADSPIDYF